jgi:hypothetical protein
MMQGSGARIAPLIAISIAVCQALTNPATRAQESPQPPTSQPPALTESGHTTIDGHAAAFTIHHLPPNAFPDLPAPISSLLASRGCLIPQTYQAHWPENLIHASLEHDGSSDWAMLCSSKGMVALLVFFASAPDHPIVLANASEADHLQPHGSAGILGFDWAIDRASPQQVHDARIGMKPRPSPTDHDALADSTIDGKTVYHFYSKGKWTLLDMPTE